MATTETETRVQTYHVFKHDEETVWHELPPISGEGKYGYYVSAEDLGALHGAGYYLLVDKDGGYRAARFMHVVAETLYREQKDEGDG